VRCAELQYSCCVSCRRLSLRIIVFDLHPHDPIFSSSHHVTGVDYHVVSRKQTLKVLLYIGTRHRRYQLGRHVLESG